MGMGNLELESQDSDISNIEDSCINWLYPRTEKEAEYMEDIEIWVIYWIKHFEISKSPAYSLRHQFLFFE